MNETVDFVRNTGFTVKKSNVNNERDKTVNKQSELGLMKSMKYSTNVHLLFRTQRNYSIKRYQFLKCILKFVAHHLKFLYVIKITRKSILHIQLLCKRSITLLYEAFLAIITDDNAHTHGY
jgi:hypothetical protein